MITLNVNEKPIELDCPDDMPLPWTPHDVLSLPASLWAVSYESNTAPANNAKQSEKTQLLGVRLSARERTIVLLMGHGLSNKRIAHELSIAPETVKSHVKCIFWKLTAQSRAQAVYRASALGLI